MPVQLLFIGTIYIIDARKGVLSTEVLSATALQRRKNIDMHIDIHGAHCTRTVARFTSNYLAACGL